MMKFDKAAIRNNCEDFFNLYSVAKDRTKDMCRIKQIHTRAVAENCYNIAKSEGLTPYECDLAWIIGELHDFARFGQAVVTKTFRDSDQFDHAKLGARILFTHNLVNDIIPDYENIDVIDRVVMEKAVYYHSTFKLPGTLSPRELMFCSIIREADQMDIFRTIVESGWETIYGNSKETILSSDISDEIAAAFYERRLADYSKRITPADYHLAHIALGFGLRALSSRKRALEQGFLPRMMDITFVNPSVQKKYEELKKISMAYLNGEM